MSSTPGLGFGSFKLNKKKEKFSAPLVPGRSCGDDGTEYITAIDKKQIESTKPVKRKEALVIPLIQNNNWREQAKERNESKKKTKTKPKDDGNNRELEVEEEAKEEPGLDLEEKARQELVDEARELNENFVERSRSSNKVIPLLLINKVPDGFEEDDNFDVSARPDNPTLDDYSKVPVEEFGMALLRGMGFRPEESKTVEPIEVKVRPKGLGLGAELPQTAKPKVTGSNTSEKLELKIGAHVLILAQQFKDFYGTIQGFDEDLSRASVRLAINSSSVDVPIFTLQLVSKEEFKKEGKVLNRSSYTKYKKETSDYPEKEENGRKEYREKSPEGREWKNEKSSSSKEKSFSSKEKLSSSKEKSFSSWIHPGLKVRIIDKYYKKGRYYEKKVAIQEVLTPNNCNCVTDRGEKLEEIESRMLETVVPRELGSKVMILDGEYKREIGKIVDRNRDKHEATVQLVSDPLIITKLHFDDVCEIVE